MVDLAGTCHGIFVPGRHLGLVPTATDLALLGFRTSAEINEERYALKVLRGDFERIISRDGIHADPEEAFSAADR